jgi:hypothetical protein
MNKSILNQYRISFNKQTNGSIKVNATSKNLDNFLYMFARQKTQLELFLQTITLALNGNYNSIPYDNREWNQEIGLNIYTGIIQNDMTFDLFLEDHYNQTKETFPLSDVKEIFQSLLEFIS